MISDVPQKEYKYNILARHMDEIKVVGPLPSLS
jgi:hypothetical protein